MTPAEIRELKEKRAKAITDARAMPSDTAEHRAAFDKAMADADDLEARIKVEERKLELERAAEAEKRAATPPPGSGAGTGEQPEQRKTGRASDEYQAAFRSYLRSGERRGLLEQRDLAVSNDASGGFLAPEQFLAQILKALDDQLWIRRLATRLGAQGSRSLGIPTLEANPADADWTEEAATIQKDTTMSVGKRRLTPQKLSKRLLVSRELLENASIAVDALIRDRLAYKFGVTEEKAFLTGAGNSRPLGVFTAHADGVPTSQDVTFGNASSIVADDLLDLKYKLKAQYQANAAWVMHRDVLKLVAKLKDGEGRYLWQPGLIAGQPDQIHGRPLYSSEYAPNTVTTGNYVMMFADFSYFWIADSTEMQVQRLDELYAETDQVGFIGRQRVDGMPVLAEAFARGKLA